MLAYLAILLGSDPPGAHGASQHLQDSDHQSSNSCTTSSEPPLYNIPHRNTLNPTLFTLTIPWKSNKISRLQAAAPTFTHSDLHWVSIIRSLMVEMQDHPTETLHARPTPNLWRQEILGRITGRRCSSCLPSSVSSVYNIIVHDLYLILELNMQCSWYVKCVSSKCVKSVFPLSTSKWKLHGNYWQCHISE